MELTRRHALAGAAALAASPLLPTAPAKAAAPLADKQAPSFYRYKVGDAQVNVISDGVNTFALPETFVLNAKKDDVNAALEKAFLPKDKVSVHFAPLVINIGGRRHRSEVDRHGGDLAFPRRPHQWVVDCGQCARVPQRRGVSAGCGVEILHG